jgi:hypothetical protein
MRVAVFLLGVACVATGLAGARNCLTMPTEAEVCTFARAAGVKGACADGRTAAEREAGDRAVRPAPVRT